MIVDWDAAAVRLPSTTRRVGGIAIFAACMAVGFAPGCGSGASGGSNASSAESAGGSRPVAMFPARDKLEAIAGRKGLRGMQGPARSIGLGFLAEPVAAGHLAERPVAEASPIEQVLVEAIGSRRDLVLSESVRCIAKEAGRFFSTEQAYPGAALQRFIASRCGSTAAAVQMSVMAAQVPADWDDARMLADWRESLSANLPRMLPSHAASVGLWIGRSDDGNATAMFASAARRAELEPIDPVPNAAGRIVIQGRMLQPVGAVVGFINQGLYGATACDVDMGMRLPLFQVSCPMADEDQEAAIELVSIQPQRALGRTFASVATRRGPDLTREFQLETFGLASGDATDDLVSDLVRHLNTIRKRGGLSPVALAQEQSETAQRVTPHFFDATFRADAATADVTDVVALGMMAGWYVRGTIRDASFLARVVGPDPDVVQWLRSALSSPSGRVGLMHPKATQVAVGMLTSDEPPLLAATVTAYRFHDDAGHAADEQRLFDRIAAARQRLGLTPPQRLDGLTRPLHQQLAAVTAGKLQPHAALDRALTTAVKQLRRSMQGLRMEALSMDTLELPDEILRAPELRLGLGVGHYKPEGAAWGQYVILVLYDTPRGPAPPPGASQRMAAL